MRHSIFQEAPVRERGDYEMINIDSFISFIEELGYSPILDKNKGNYREQSYQDKTKERNTAYHGQFRLNFLKPNEDVGIVVFSSNDCQLPFMLFAGPVVGEDVIPFTKILSVKHTKADIDKVDGESLAFLIKEKVIQTRKTLDSWEETEVKLKHIISAFQKTNEYKASIMKCLKMHSVNCSNKKELFHALINSFIYGIGTSETGRKVKALKHLRRHLQLSEFIVKALV